MPHRRGQGGGGNRRQLGQWPGGPLAGEVIVVVELPDQDVDLLERFLIRRQTRQALPHAGDRRFETELGVLDAELGPQLERLAKKLREALSR